MSILETITNDLDWREKEIAAMRILLSSDDITDSQRRGLLRAAWAMLYAHFEGFCKSTLVAYYGAIVDSGLVCQHLPKPTQLFALEKRLKRMKGMTNENFLAEVSFFDARNLQLTPDFPEVDTQSNLWPSVLIDLLTSADLDSGKVREHEIKLKTLVSRRNSIAHGENNVIVEIGYYLTYENVVYDVMYDLAFQVDRRLSLPPYVAGNAPNS